MPEPTNELAGNKQPVVYVVDRNHDSNDAVDLQKLLAPIWRWRWVELSILLLTVLAAGWYYARTAESTWEIVINPGGNDYAMVISQMEQVVIPGAVQDITNGWKPVVSISPTSEAIKLIKKDVVNPELLTIRFSTSHGTDELHTLLADGLRERIQAVSARLALVTSAEQTSAMMSLAQTITSKEAALSLISKPDYVAALRGQLDKSIAMTTAALVQQTELEDQITTRGLFIEERVVTLASTLESLLASLNLTNGSTAGTQQLLADRIATLRLELEHRIPAERLELNGRLAACRAEQATLNAILIQKGLESVNFISDLTVRQEAVQATIDDAKTARDLFNAKMQATLIHQPLTILDEFRRIEPRDQQLLMTFAILILGCIASLVSAYVLEALRIARLGTLAG